MPTSTPVIIDVTPEPTSDRDILLNVLNLMETLQEDILLIKESQERIEEKLDEMGYPTSDPYFVTEMES